MDILNPLFKDIGKIRLGSAVIWPYLRLELSNSSFLVFHWVEFKKTCLIFYFGGFSWQELTHFRGFIRTILNIEPYSPLKPTKVGFFFIGPNSLCRAEDLAAVNQVTQVGFKELRLEPKFLNRGLWINFLNRFINFCKSNNDVFLICLNFIVKHLRGS